MKMPKEFDTGFDIVFNTIHGKNTMFFCFQEFLGSYHFSSPGSCFTPQLEEVYAAIKRASIKEKPAEE
jgi:hypothetical protein